MVFMLYMKNFLASIFKWLVAWKWGLPRPNVLYEYLSHSPTPSYTITNKKKLDVCRAKVIEGAEAHEGPLRVLFMFVSNSGSSLGFSVIESF